MGAISTLAERSRVSEKDICDLGYHVMQIAEDEYSAPTDQDFHMLAERYAHTTSLCNLTTVAVDAFEEKLAQVSEKYKFSVPRNPVMDFVGCPPMVSDQDRTMLMAALNYARPLAHDFLRLPSATTLHQHREQMLQARGESYRRALSSLGVKFRHAVPIIPGSDKGMVRRAHDVARYFPEHWMDANTPVRLSLTRLANSRPQYRVMSHKYGENREILMGRRNVTPATMIHELSHYCEDNVPSLTRLEDDFLQRRSAGMRPEDINGMPGEVGYPYAFDNPYMGRVYGDSARREVLSVGMEGLFGRNGLDWGFTYDFEGRAPDVEVRGFILGLLAAAVSF